MILICLSQLNDVYPTAIKVGLIFAIEQLNSPFQNLIESFKNKSDEFCDMKNEMY